MDKYQVGDLIHFRDDDPIVDGWDAAMKEAERQENMSNDFEDRPIGIWRVDDDDNKTIEAIWYSGDCFTP